MILFSGNSHIYKWLILDLYVLYYFGFVRKEKNQEIACYQQRYDDNKVLEYSLHIASSLWVSHTYYNSSKRKNQHKYAVVKAYIGLRKLIQLIRSLKCAKEEPVMTINDAVALRTLRLMQQRDMTQYRLEQDAGILHGSMDRILQSKNKTVTLTTLYRLARGFDMTVQEFLDDDVFRRGDLELD